MNIKFFLFCPIPDDQKPIQEYKNLKENFFFKWTTLKRNSYFLFLIFLSCTINIFFLSISIFFSFSLLIFLIFLILFRYIEIKKRFNFSSVPYEEGSWYNSEIWEKPFSIIKNDKLIKTQRIMPKIYRLSKTLIFFVLLMFLLYFITSFEISFLSTNDL